MNVLPDDARYEIFRAGAGRFSGDIIFFGSTLDGFSAINMVLPRQIQPVGGRMCGRWRLRNMKMV